jgi:hypothetical protein
VHASNAFELLVFGSALQEVAYHLTCHKSAVNWSYDRAVLAFWKNARPSTLGGFLESEEFGSASLPFELGWSFSDFTSLVSPCLSLCGRCLAQGSSFCVSRAPGSDDGRSKDGPDGFTRIESGSKEFSSSEFPTEKGGE